MCAPLVQPATAKKIIFVKKKEDLHEHIEEEVLEEDYWGKNTFKYSHDEYMDMLLKEEADWLEANKRILAAIQDWFIAVLMSTVNPILCLFCQHGVFCRWESLTRRHVLAVR